MEDLSEKIRELIRRNDFATARRMLQKRSAALTAAERQRLEAEMARRQRERLAEERRRARRRKYGFWVFRLSGPVKRALLALSVLLSLALILGEFLRASRQAKDLLCAGNFLLWAALCGAEAAEERASRRAGEKPRRRALYWMLGLLACGGFFLYCAAVSKG